MRIGLHFRRLSVRPGCPNSFDGLNWSKADRSCAPRDAGSCGRRITSCGALRVNVRGNWGVLSAEDRKSNFEAVFDGSRILSAYPIDAAQPLRGLIW
jgi:hypothetical protein